MAGWGCRSAQARRASYIVLTQVIDRYSRSALCGRRPLASRAMRVAMVASECEPFAKTGGLADVVDALSRALGQQGHEVDVYLPMYRGIDPPGPVERLDLSIPTGLRRKVAGQRAELRRRAATGSGWSIIRRASIGPTTTAKAGATIPTTASASRCSVERRSRRCAPRAGRWTSSMSTTGRACRLLLLLRHRYAATGARLSRDGPHLPQPRLPRVGAA